MRIFNHCPIWLCFSICFCYDMRNFSQVANLSMESPIPKFVASPSYDSSRRAITVLSSSTYSGLFFPYGPIVTEAMRFALGQLRKLPNWLPGYEIVLEVFDDKCEDAGVINKFVRRMRSNGDAENRFPLFVGAECVGLSQFITGLMLDHYNFIGLSLYKNDKRIFTEHQKVQNYFFLRKRPDTYFLALAKFFQRFGWQQLSLVSQHAEFENLNDLYMIDVLDQANITLQYFGKVESFSEDEAEMDKMFEGVKARDSRIILSQLTDTVSLACFLHRHGLYGASYAVIVIEWYNIDENFDEPIWPWCTRDMVFEVYNNVWIYGDAQMADIFGPDFTDSIESTSNKLLDSVQQTIEGADPFKVMGGAFLYYERVATLGLVLNETENLLNAKNETLVDWVTSSEKFRENGSEIVNIIKEAFYSLNSEGLLGEYSFDRKTGLCSGYNPITFNKMKVDVDKSNGRRSINWNVIAYYKANEDRLIFIEENIKWNTIDGLAPPDSINYIAVKRPVFPSCATDYLFQSLAGILICFSVTLGIIGKVAPKFYLPVGIYPILLGNVVIISHVFLVPHIEQLPRTACQLILTLVLMGYWIINAGLAHQLYGFCLKMTTPVQAPKKSTRKLTETGESSQTSKPPGAKRQHKSPGRNGGLIERHPGFAAIFYTVGLIALFAIMFSVAPPALHSAIANMTVEYSATNPSLAYKPFRFECTLSTSELVAQLGQLIPLIWICISQLVLLIMLALLSYKLHSNRKRFVIPKAVSRVGHYTYCQLLIIIAGVFIVSMDVSNGQYVQIVTSSVAGCLVLLNLGLVVLPKMKRLGPGAQIEPEIPVPIVSTKSKFTRPKKR